MKIVLVYNPNSGSALSAQTLRSKCAKANIELEALIAIKDGFKQKLQPYIEKNYTIGVIGGDGTVSTVAGMVASTGAVLAPLPGGTLNHFTKDLGIPQDIDKALGRLSEASVRSIDIASVNDIIFINNSSLGLYPASLLEREEFESQAGKWPAAVMASFRALVRIKVYKVTINNETFRTPFIFVGNNIYDLSSIGGTTRKNLTDGVLTVFVAKTSSRRVLLKIALFALIGKARELPEFDVFHPRKITISTNSSTLHISHDGEITKLHSPLEYILEKSALKVL